MAASKLKAELDALWWSLFADYVEIWREKNPGASAADLVQQVQQQAKGFTEIAVAAEVDGGATQEQAEYIVRNLTNHRDAAEELLS